ncbi:uncharacterized protein LOC108677560 isoform X2 [Hyalella azteca]|uniref:non-specific serine/threonine protein kinase n=1 Tax=Hyalella azteca TaxID=294128 RepID=A0A979FIV6_HYAAZ|nr:uncharacterized protein LOC108677560 isoform X2 [Hyalella azteca]
MDQYVMVRVLGEGSFGSAFLARHKTSSELLVLKKIPLRKLTRQAVADAMKEVLVLSSLSHPHITQFKHSLELEGELVIAMEYCGGGDLRNVLNQRGGVLFPQERILDWFVQLCLAVKYIHDRHILHRDIKSQNVFLTEDGRIKLGDFGISKVLESSKELASTCIGTPYYLSPEMCQNKPYNSKSDVWALGCVLYEMVALKHPFEATCMKSLVLKIMKGSYQPVPSKFSWDLKALIRQILQSNPVHRPSVTTILAKKIVLERVPKFLDGIAGNNDLMVALRERKDAEHLGSGRVSFSATNITGPAAKYGQSAVQRKIGRKSSPLKSSGLAKRTPPKGISKFSLVSSRKLIGKNIKQCNISSNGENTLLEPRKRRKSKSIEGLRCKLLATPSKLESPCIPPEKDNSEPEPKLLAPSVELILKDIHEGKYCVQQSYSVKQEARLPRNTSHEMKILRRKSAESLLDDDWCSQQDDGDTASLCDHTWFEEDQDYQIPGICMLDSGKSSKLGAITEFDLCGKILDDKIEIKNKANKEICISKDFDKKIDVVSKILSYGAIEQNNRSQYNTPAAAVDKVTLKSTKNRVDSNDHEIPAKFPDIVPSLREDSSLVSSTPLKQPRSAWHPWDPAALHEMPLEITSSKMDSTTDKVIAHGPGYRVIHTDSVLVDPCLDASARTLNLSRNAPIGFEAINNHVSCVSGSELVKVTIPNVSPIEQKSFARRSEHSRDDCPPFNERRQWLKRPADDVMDILSNARVVEATLDSFQTSALIESLIKENSPAKSQRCFTTKRFSCGVNRGSQEVDSTTFNSPRKYHPVTESQHSENVLADKTYILSSEEGKNKLSRTYSISDSSVSEENYIAGTECQNEEFKNSNFKVPKPQKRLINILLRRESQKKVNAAGSNPDLKSTFVVAKSENVSSETVVLSSGESSSEVEEIGAGAGKNQLGNPNLVKSRRSFSDFLRKIVSAKPQSEVKELSKYKMDDSCEDIQRPPLELPAEILSEENVQITFSPSSVDVIQSCPTSTQFCDNVVSSLGEPDAVDNKSYLPYDAKFTMTPKTACSSESGYRTITSQCTHSDITSEDLDSRLSNTCKINKIDQLSSKSTTLDKNLSSPVDHCDEDLLTESSKDVKAIDAIPREPDPSSINNHVKSPEPQAMVVPLDSVERERCIRRLAMILVSNIIEKSKERLSAQLLAGAVDGKCEDVEQAETFPNETSKISKQVLGSLVNTCVDCTSSASQIGCEGDKSNSSCLAEDSLSLHSLGSINVASAHEVNDGFVERFSIQERSAFEMKIVDHLYSCLWSTLSSGCGSNSEVTTAMNSTDLICTAPRHENLDLEDLPPDNSNEKFVPSVDVSATHSFSREMNVTVVEKAPCSSASEKCEFPKETAIEKEFTAENEEPVFPEIASSLESSMEICRNDHEVQDTLSKNLAQSRSMRTGAEFNIDAASCNPAEKYQSPNKMCSGSSACDIVVENRLSANLQVPNSIDQPEIIGNFSTLPEENSNEQTHCESFTSATFLYPTIDVLHEEMSLDLPPILTLRNTGTLTPKVVESASIGVNERHEMMDVNKLIPKGEQPVLPSFSGANESAFMESEKPLNNILNGVPDVVTEATIGDQSASDIDGILLCFPTTSRGDFSDFESKNRDIINSVQSLTDIICEVKQMPDEPYNSHNNSLGYSAHALAPSNGFSLTKNDHLISCDNFSGTKIVADINESAGKIDEASTLFSGPVSYDTNYRLSKGIVTEEEISKKLSVEDLTYVTPSNDGDVFGWIEEQRVTLENSLGLNVFIECHRASVSVAAQSSSLEEFMKNILPVLARITEKEAQQTRAEFANSKPASSAISQAASHLGISNVPIDSFGGQPHAGLLRFDLLNGQIESTITMEVSKSGQTADLSSAGQAADLSTAGQAADLSTAGQAADLSTAGQAADLSTAGQAADLSTAGQAADLSTLGQAADLSTAEQAAPVVDVKLGKFSPKLSARDQFLTTEFTGTRATTSSTLPGDDATNFSALNEDGNSSFVPGEDVTSCLHVAMLANSFGDIEESVGSENELPVNCIAVNFYCETLSVSTNVPNLAATTEFSIPHAEEKNKTSATPSLDTNENSVCCANNTRALTCLESPLYSHTQSANEMLPGDGEMLLGGDAHHGPACPTNAAVTKTNDIRTLALQLWALIIAESAYTS